MRERPFPPPEPTRRKTIAVDVGASKIVAAVVGADGEIIVRTPEVRTPARREGELVDVIGGLVRELRSRYPEAEAVGVGCAGLVRWPSGALDYAGNHEHGDVELRELLEADLGVDVVVDNDGNAAAWAESVAARTGGRDLLFLSLGTGLGSGLVSGGRLVRGRGGRGAEFGHVSVSDSKEPCSCGRTGCLETVASGLALVRSGEDIVRSEPDGVLARLVGNAPVTAGAVIDAALEDDPAALAAVRVIGRALGETIAADLLPLFDVSLVAVGGGLAVLGDRLLDPLREACGKALGDHRYLVVPEVRLAVHRQSATLVGAGLMAHALLDGRNLDCPSAESPGNTRVARPAVSARSAGSPAVGSRGELARVVLHISPHPDDESIGAPCTLLALQDAGWRVINLTCSLGRPADHERRRTELQAAMEVAGFKLVLPTEPVAISRHDDHDLARRTVSRWIAELIKEHNPALVVGPHPQDGHHGHETVALAIRDSIGCANTGITWWMWSIWADLSRPTLLVPAIPEHLATSQEMIDKYRGENERNNYRVMLAASRKVNAVRGVEQVFGFGANSPLRDVTHAELLTEVCRADGRWWIGEPRILEQAEPTGEWQQLSDSSPVIGPRRKIPTRVRTRLALGSSPAVPGLVSVPRHAPADSSA